MEHNNHKSQNVAGTKKKYPKLNLRRNIILDDSNPDLFVDLDSKGQQSYGYDEQGKTICKITDQLYGDEKKNEDESETISNTIDMNDSSKYNENTDYIYFGNSYYKPKKDTNEPNVFRRILDYILFYGLALYSNNFGLMGMLMFIASIVIFNEAYASNELGFLLLVLSIIFMFIGYKVAKSEYKSRHRY